ncbi:hypothetical protein DPMN_101749 [Dreissena polymorpha]|uniref:Transposase n=1 Tax=Dreissena polymorpha TaxID=45954 RepID=A0A9D4LI38_DREPO|nr:hypothetical protein DPMN_101749 [Dreissena polymorpha]
MHARVIYLCLPSPLMIRLSPPYSPDLAPMDFRVFPEVKSQLRGIRFASKQELTVAAKRIVSSFDADWCARPSSTLPPPLLPSLFRRCSETTIHLRTPPYHSSWRSFRSRSSGSQQSKQKRTSGSKNDGTRLINRAARKKSHIRPSSDNVMKRLSTYEQLPLRFVILRGLLENLRRLSPCRDVHAQAVDRALLY